MRQEINFLQKPKKEAVPSLSFSRALCVAGFLLVFLSGMSWYGNQELDNVLKDIAAIEKNNASQKIQIVDSQGVTKSQTELRLLEKQLMNKYQLWINYKNITKAGKKGFSKHFYYIAQLADKEMSLYEIDIYDRGNRLSLKGYSKQAAIIPVYINNLRNQQEFKEMSFGDLSMQRLEEHNIMQFSLDRREIKDKKEPIKNKKIDVSELIKMSLLSQAEIDDGSRKVSLANIVGEQ